MDPSRRFRIAAALVLILVGAALLIMHWMPSLWAWIDISLWLPLVLIVLGALLLLVAAGLGLPALIVPAGALGGFGVFLFWQAATGISLHWAYISVSGLAFLGLGLFLSGAFGVEMRSLRMGSWLVVLSGVLYAIVGSLLGDLDLLQPHLILFMVALAYLVLARPRFKLD